MKKINFQSFFVGILFTILLVIFICFGGCLTEAEAQSSIPAMERIARELRVLNGTLKEKKIKCECLCSCPSSSSPR